MKTIKVKVKQKHIEKGDRREGRSCPINLAMRELGFEGHNVQGGGFGVYINDQDLSKDKGQIKLPEKADNFINDFDEGESVSPFEFNIRVPNKLVPLPLLLPK